MRKLIILAALFSPLALADAISVAAHSVLRLPNKASVVHLQRLEVADSATLVLPASLVDLRVDELHLGQEARIAIVPAETTLQLEVQRASFGEGSQIVAHGAPGTYEKAAKAGRNLELQLHELKASTLAIDARGGAGAPGYVGLDGANGKPGAAPGARPAAAPMATTVAMAMTARRVAGCGWCYRQVFLLSASWSSLMAVRQAWRVQPASRGPVAQARAAWCTVLRVVRQANLGLRVSRERRVQLES